jgi:hypothetical protein
MEREGPQGSGLGLESENQMRVEWLTIAFLGALGCTSTIPKQAYLASNLVPRASFDLGCPPNQIATTDLGPKTSHAVKNGDDWVIVEDLAPQQGVTGCGKKATYVLVDYKWVLNAESSPSERRPDVSKSN